MSSSGNPNAIRIPVVVDLSQANSSLAQFRTQSKQEMVSTIMGMQVELQKGEKAAIQTATVVANTGTTMKESMRGAQPAITGATQALVLMGSKGSPAVMGLTHALTSMVQNGFTPLGMAIGAATLAVGYFATRTDAAAESSKSFIKAAEAQLAVIAELEAKSSLGLRAKQAGVSPGELSSSDEQDRLYRFARGRGLDLTRAKAELDAANADIAKTSVYNIDFAQLKRLSAARDLVDSSKKELDLAQEALRLYEKSAVERKAASEYAKIEADAQQKINDYERSTVKPGFVGRSQNPDLLGAIGGVATYDGGADAIVKDVYRREEEFFSDLKSRLMEKTGTDISTFGGRGSMPDSFKYQKDPRSGFNFLRSNEEVTDAQRKQAEDEAKRYAEAYKQHAQSFGIQAAQGMESALSQALQGKTDWKGLLQGLFSAVQGGIADALAAGIMDALGVRKAAAGLSESVYSALAPAASSAAGSAAGSAGASASAAAAKDTIVIAMVPDAPAADAIVAKATQSGARAFAAKMNGQAVASGSIPSRRRR